MKTKTVILFTSGNDIHVNATLEVEGLGEIKIEKCLSKDTIDKVFEECIIALKAKMGQNV